MSSIQQQFNFKQNDITKSDLVDHINYYNNTLQKYCVKGSVVVRKGV